MGDSILGAIVAAIAFHRFHDLDEGGLTRIKVALVSGASLSDVADRLGFADVIVFGSSETGTGKRGLTTAGVVRAGVSEIIAQTVAKGA